MVIRTRKPTTDPKEDTVPTATATPAPTTRTRKTAPPIDLTALVVESAPQPVKAGAVPAADNPAMGWLRKSWNDKKATAPGVFRGSGQQVRVPQANATMVSNLIRSAANAMGAESGERIGTAIQVVPDKDGMVYVRFCAKTAKAPAAKPTTA